MVLLLHDGHGLTNPQIAELLQCSVPTVKIRVHRARSRLRATLADACDFGADDRGELVCEQRRHSPATSSLTRQAGTSLSGHYRGLLLHDFLLKNGGNHYGEDPFRCHAWDRRPYEGDVSLHGGKGSCRGGHETGIILMMEAAPLIKDHIAAEVQGVGVPPLKKLMNFLTNHNVRISVCEPSGRALGVTEEDFAGKNSGFGTSVDAANAYAGYDRVVTF